MAEHLGEFETLILLALLRLGDDGYGVAVRREIEERTGRNVSLGALYTTFERMERKGYVVSRVGAPSAVRGGRRKKFYRLEPPGASALSRSYGALRRMSDGLEAQIEHMRGSYSDA